MRKDAEGAFLQGVSQASAGTAVEKCIRLDGHNLLLSSPSGQTTLDLLPSSRVFVVGAGKACAAMAQSVEKILGSRLTGGIVIVKDGYSLPTEKITVLEASPPIPDPRGIRATGRQ